MKVYFITSPRATSELKDKLAVIYKTIEDLGHTNVTDFTMDVEVEDFYISDIKRFYQKTTADLKKADVCIFETTLPSLAIGHLISMALQYGKPVIALYTDNKVPFFLSGVADDKIQILSYGSDNLKNLLKDAIEYAHGTTDTRFNFFISPRHINYLDWIAKSKKIPRSVYLRDLIQQDMGKNDEFQKAA